MRTAVRFLCFRSLLVFMRLARCAGATGYKGMLVGPGHVRDEASSLGITNVHVLHFRTRKQRVKCLFDAVSAGACASDDPSMVAIGLESQREPAQGVRESLAGKRLAYFRMNEYRPRRGILVESVKRVIREEKATLLTG